MDTDSKDDAATKHILDYYKKYSQNRDLPKYFSGTSVSYLPDIKGSVSPVAEIETSVKTNISIIVTSEEINKNVEEPIPNSRGSSPMSNHKLEWDSGADIGYGNCQEKRLRRSLSLPTIADLVEKRTDNDFGPVTSNPPVTRSQSSSSDGNVKVILLTCSSSSEYHSDENVCSSHLKEKESSTSLSSTNIKAPVNTGSSSSSSSNRNVDAHNINVSSSDSSNKQSLKQFASTLSYLKQKIGVPGAHSTPKFLDEGQDFIDNACSGTPVFKMSSSNNGEDKKVNSKSIGKKLLKKPCNLTVVPARVSEEDVIHKKHEISSSHLGKVLTKYQNQKIVNLAVTKPITVECTCSGQHLTNRPPQIVAKKSTVAVQTDEVTEKELQLIIRNSQRMYNNQSLVYFEYSESDKNSGRSTQTDSDIIESNCDSFEYLVEQPSQLKDSALHNNDMKSGQEQATNLKRTQKTHDLRTNYSEENSEKSSSKEFCLGNLVSAGLADNVEDDIGKSVYLLQRLLKSKKYDPVTKKRYIKKIIKKITESKYLEDSSTSSDLFVPKKLPKTADRNENNLLQSNIPWYPAGDQPKLSPRRKQLVQKTFTQDFMPGQQSSKEEISSAPEIVPINSRDMRKNPFTLTNNEFLVNRKCESADENKSIKTFSETGSTSLDRHYESSFSSAKSYQNWKEEKTLSEKILEKQSQEKSHSSNGNGDCFVKFADKERQYQISWINNEISHLGKLKGLLEKPKVVRKNPLNVKKTTNVYTVFNENDTPSKPKRNYVIETVIGSKSSSEMNFKLDGQVYTIQEYLNARKGRELKRPRQVTGNIEVISSDSITNIKVTTYCEECKKSPCICNLVEDEPGCACLGKCGSPTCICLKETPINTSTHPTTRQDYSKKLISTMCYICKKYICVCGDAESKERLKTEATNSNNGVLGTFIPAAPSRPTTVKFSTFPSTSKEENRRKQNLIPSSQKVDVLDQTLSKSVRSPRDEETTYGSLRKVFENCACTQDNCTCDFVEKLMNRFSKTDVPVSTACDNKCLQTDQGEIQSVGLQTRIDTQSQKQQTTILTVDDKCLQTEKYVSESESQTIGIQTWVNNQNEIQQTSVAVVNAQTEFLKLEGNFQNIGIQTKTDVKDQILQTSRSLDEQNGLKNNTKGVSFVDVNTSPQPQSVRTSPDHVTKQKGTPDSPKLHFVGTSAAVASQTSAANSVHSHSDSSRPTSSSKSSGFTSDHQKKVISICCCTQSESKPQGRNRGRNVRVQIDSSGTHSEKEDRKRKIDSLTTNSASYEICPSILVSSYNDTSRSMSEESSSKPPLVICVCCSESYPMNKISVLGSKNENYPLCCNCLTKRPILTSVCYAGPEENCPCSKPSTYKTDMSDATTKRTAMGSDVEEYCTCTKPFQFKNSKYCSHCQFKLRNTAKSKNGIAYTLTLESDCLNKIRRRRKKVPLEEIRLKVPSPSKKKKHKDKENVSKRDKEERKRGKEDDEERTCNCGRIICTSNCHVHGVSSKHRRHKDSLTLQEHLQRNRPDFIHSAEFRRHMVSNSKSARVFANVDAKLKFAEENMQQHSLRKPRKLFTEQEMKEITKRNYKKLPEVKEKIYNQREQRLRNADRFIVDVFARKIQRSVLKGKSSFPIDANVICLPKTCNC
ncbi:uncharacterized protein LOC108917157 [Anoplophora glabripennis]|uniref:uncharacterized protein LOC108917157 n=1 Tax=Anoplophora glabripennis TaxID=217634 RepID=UPI0008739F3D|nr:uncharacterized protein LOC108917157 [Anoplophora glabripennis]